MTKTSENDDVIETLRKQLWGINYDLGMALKIKDDAAMILRLVDAAHKKCGWCFDALAAHESKTATEREYTGLCSAHREGEDKNCKRCYPEREYGLVTEKKKVDTCED